MRCVGLYPLRPQHDKRRVVMAVTSNIHNPLASVKMHTRGSIFGDTNSQDPAEGVAVGGGTVLGLVPLPVVPTPVVLETDSSSNPPSCRDSVDVEKRMGVATPSTALRESTSADGCDAEGVPFGSVSW